VGNASGSYAYFDDIRIHPSDAVMNTYTYDPMIGVTSVSGPNNTPTTYEYDDFGRLELIRDSDGNILQSYEYHYAEEH
jgi:YD repeat-containing protein